jgi:hypothetical protein
MNENAKRLLAEIDKALSYIGGLPTYEGRDANPNEVLMTWEQLHGEFGTIDARIEGLASAGGVFMPEPYGYTEAAQRELFGYTKLFWTRSSQSLADVAWVEEWGARMRRFREMVSLHGPLTDSSTIPPENQTRPLSKTEAAKCRIGHRDYGDVRRPDMAVGTLMENRKVLFMEAPGHVRKYIFQKSDFPAREWPKISPP